MPQTGFGYPGQQSPWPPPSTTAPPPPWVTPAAPAPPSAPTPDAAPAPSWPAFGTPAVDPDATSVFDTSGPTGTHPVVDEAMAKPKAVVDAKTGPAATAEGGEPAPGVNAPHWDAKRNTYIQWDPELMAWMQWDSAKNEWQGLK